MKKIIGRGSNSLVSMVGALPPLKGNAYYCESLASALSDFCKIQFISFRNLYPELLYPGGTKEEELNIHPGTKNLRILRTVDYYNPISWVVASIRACGSIIHLQWWSVPTLPIYLIFIVVAKLRRKKIVVTVHNVIPHESTIFATIGTKIIARSADKVLVHARRNVEDAVSLYGLDAAKVTRIPMPAHDMYKDESTNHPYDARERLSISHATKVILFFGNIRPYKGLHILLESLNLVQSSLSKNNSVVLIIAGKCWTDWAAYQAIIDRYELHECVRILNRYIPRIEVQSLFTASDLVVCPYTEFDAQSGVGNIALAFSKPLLATDVGGLNELVIDDRALVKANSITDLAESISRILFDDVLLNELASHSKYLASENNWVTMASKTLEIYESLLFDD